jgi:hypothetical protein
MTALCFLKENAKIIYRDDSKPPQVLRGGVARCRHVQQGGNDFPVWRLHSPYGHSLDLTFPGDIFQEKVKPYYRKKNSKRPSQPA